MAVSKANGQVVEVDDEIREVKLKEVDINDTSLYEGVEQEIDLKEDWQAKAAPPPKGRYRLQLFPVSKETNAAFQQGIKGGYAEDDPAGAYYIKPLMLKVVSEDKWKGSIVDYKVSTGVPRGKITSSMAGLMGLGGVKLHPKMTDRGIASMFSKYLAKEPILVADCDWSAWDNESKDKDNPYGVLLLRGMDKFPKRADGGSSHIVRNKKGAEFVAKLKIVKWVGRQTAPTPAAPAAPAVAAPANKQVAKPKPAPEPEIVIDESLQVMGNIDMGDDGEVILEG